MYNGSNHTVVKGLFSVTKGRGKAFQHLVSISFSYSIYKLSEPICGILLYLLDTEFKALHSQGGFLLCITLLLQSSELLLHEDTYKLT